MKIVVWLVAACVALIPVVSIAFPPELSCALFPALGAEEVSTRFITSTVLLFLVLFAIALPKPATSRQRAFLSVFLASVGLILALLHIDLRNKYVRLVPVPSQGGTACVSVGSIRSNFALKTYGSIDAATDESMLYDRGPWEDQIELLWTRESLLWSRRQLLWSYMGSMICSLLLGLTVANGREPVTSKGSGGHRHAPLTLCENSDQPLSQQKSRQCDNRVTPERYELIAKLFSETSKRSASMRLPYLIEACGGDDELRLEVESMLVADDQAGEFLQRPLDDLATAMLTDRHAKTFTNQTLGEYVLLARIGAGGMGEVYLAKDTRLGRKAALKLLPEEFAIDEKSLRRFEQEARVVSSLNHPNIVTIYGVGQAGLIHFLATEFVEGSTLRAEMAKGPMEWQTAGAIAAQVASALCAAHSAGIVHRDIKPENVMIRDDGLVKVLDFGVAKRIDNALSADGGAPSLHVTTLPGVVMGTIRYMSPEQARGGPVDARTDVFSLGAVLYEMIAGRPAFPGETASDIIAEILKTEPSALTLFAPEAPAELECILRKALQKDKEKRYQSANDLALDFKKLQLPTDFEREGRVRETESKTSPRLDSALQNRSSVAPTDPTVLE